mgnify:CR=1 FL=1
MQQVWSTYDASQSLQELRILQQERDHRSGLISMSLYIQGLSNMPNPIDIQFNPILTQLI